MVIALLAVLGVDLIVIVVVLRVVLSRRRSDGLGVTVSVTHQPGARFGVGAPAQV